MDPRRLARGEEGRPRAAKQRYAAGDDVMKWGIIDRDRAGGPGQRVVDRDLRPAKATRITDGPAGNHADKADHFSLHDEDAAYGCFAHAQRFHDSDVRA